jgi:peroxidase
MAPSLRWALLAGPALATLVRGSQWPYTREFTNRSTPVDEINEIIPNYFVRWLVSSLEHSDVSNPSGGLNEAFYIPEDRDLSEVQSTDDLYDLIASQNVKPGQLPRTIWDAVPVERQRNFSEIDHARMLFANLDYEIEEECISKKENYWRVCSTPWSPLCTELSQVPHRQRRV